MGFIFLILALIPFFVVLHFVLNNRRIVRLFSDTSVCVGGARGSGKDLLFNHVVESRKASYISNMVYGGTSDVKSVSSVKSSDFVRIPFEPSVQWSLGGNVCRDFIEGDIKSYKYPFPDGIDYYISDGGVYFPSQEFSSLNKKYPSFPLFQALVRHLGDCNIHVNVQAFGRLWDKLREQFEYYILCRSSRVLFGHIVFQRLTVYERYQSAVDKVPAFKRGIGKKSRLQYQDLLCKYGLCRNYTLVYIMKHKYDSRRFKSILEGSVNEKC